MSEKLDIILFGATGFTGKHAIPFIEKFSKTNTKKLTWGVAGRSEEKLKNVLNQWTNQTGISFDNIPIITAEVQKEETIKDMVRQARIIINCCGPYYICGEPVVKACVEEGSHYVDVTSEILFSEEMQLKYHQKAQEKGVYIISACGFVSIPIDLGIAFLQQNFTGTLNSVEAYLEIWQKGKQIRFGSTLTFSTWQSFIHNLGHKKKVEKIRQQLFQKQLPKFKPRLKAKGIFGKSDVIEDWSFQFDSTDLSVVKRTQRYFYEEQSKRPVQVETYITINSFLKLIFLSIGFVLLRIVTKFTCGRQLLLKYAEGLTLGFVTRQPPKEERLKDICFKTTLYGKGWKETLSDVNEQFTTPPNKTTTLVIEGYNPAYYVTNVCLVLAAITVITETDKLPPSGGVYPPGYAFANTSLLKQLKENDVSFETVGEKDL